ncbi:MAG: TolC family protein [Chitinophagaceae bacterium]|nr:MAG: TolC family protein [Chitinophagaceae bacterium]
MRNMKIRMMFFLLLLAGFASAQQRYELTVKEAVELAYRNVIEVKNAQIDYKIQEAKNREILGQAYPQLIGNAGANYYIKLPAILFPDATSTAVYSILQQEGVNGANGPITKVPDPVLRQVSFQQPWNLQVGATLQQLLFQPDVFVGLQARQAALDLSASAIDVVKERIKDSAYKRYYAILIAEKQLFFTDESLKRLQKLYADDSIMYKNGFAERLDLDRVQVQINNLQSTRNTISNAINISYAALKLSLGLPQQDVVVLKEDLNTNNIKDGLLDESFRYEDRAVIRQLGNAKRLQELDVKRNRLGGLPTVAFGANYTLNGQGQKFFTNSNTLWINSAYVGLNINVPIFDGFQRRYKTLQAELNVEKTENNITNVKQAIDFEQNITKSSLRNALADLDLQERNMLLAEKVFNTTKLKFQEGLGSSFEVLTADTEMQRAQANYFNALYNAIVARISYQNSLGKL